MIGQFVARYTTGKTRRGQASILRRLLDGQAPAALTPLRVLDWIRGGGRLANNSVRQRASLARTFLHYCDRHGIGPGLDLEEELRVIRRAFPTTYGKAQSAHSARWLDADEARRLIAACSDGTWIGSRDQVAIRLGLLGIRVAEVTGMTWGDLSPDGTLSWLGKGRKPRTIRVGDTFLAILTRWREAYERHLGRPVRPDDPIVVGQVDRFTTGIADQQRPLNWGHPTYRQAYARLLGGRAGQAGLGHVAPHDLRRTTARLLHDARGADGGHLFTVADIQRVLGHSLMSTTQIYLNQLDTSAIDRAKETLDL